MFIVFQLLLVFLAGFVDAKEKICLNMIVKNESRVITRCLDSVIPVIDYWVIVDTGSTDGTQEIIKKHLKNIPGELHERPWKNFGHNRTEAFQLAKGKGDYILFMDADDTLEFETERKFPKLTHDLYNMWRGTKEFTYIKPQLVRANLPWRWVGVTHEYLDCVQRFTSATLKEIKYLSGDGGASTYDPEKFLKNVTLLTEGLKDEPNNTRYVFYLAESYRDAGDKAKALEWYQKRVDRGGWEEEVFWSKLQIAHMLKDLGLPSSIVLESYKLAHAFRPHRPEPIYYLCDLLMKENKYEEAYQWLKKRSPMKISSKDALFNEDWIEDYGFAFQLGICAYYIGQFQESLDACNQLLLCKNLPDHLRKQAEINRSYSLKKTEQAGVKERFP
jgi:glycosyltransferase involved in cell wall biosynthesis